MSNNLVTIRAIYSPGKIFSGARKIKTVQSPTGELREQVEKTGYEGSTLPGTTQFLLPEFDHDEGKFLCEVDQNTINELVKKARFVDETGNVITECSFFNSADPFITQLKLVLKEGQATLNPAKPSDKALEYFLAGRDLFVRKGNDKFISKRTKYVITSYELDQVASSGKIDEVTKAITYFGNLSFDKQVKIAAAMEIPVNSKTEPEVVKGLIFSKINSEEVNKRGERYTSEFINLCELAPEILEIKYKIFNARKAGVLKKAKQGWLLFGKTIAATDVELEEYFTDPSNNEDLERIDESLLKK